MIVWLLYIVGLAVAVAVLTLIFGKVFGRGEVMPPLADNADIKQLNAQALERGDVTAVRFDTVIRGYRQDQVDAVIEQLVAELDRARSASQGK